MKVIIIKIIKLLPVKLLAKYLPDFLALILTKALGFLLTKYPHKAAVIAETVKEITAAIIHAIDAAADKKITKEEIERQKELWREVFK